MFLLLWVSVQPINEQIRVVELVLASVIEQYNRIRQREAVDGLEVSILTSLDVEMCSDDIYPSPLSCRLQHVKALLPG